MGFPLILAGLLPLKNPSFEDALGAEWTLAGGGSQTRSAGAARSAGDGIPSAYGLNQTTNGQTATQGIDITYLPSWIRNNVTVLSVVAMRNGGGNLVVSGTGVTSLSQFQYGYDASWKLVRRDFKLASNATTLSIQLAATGACLWDRVLAGLLIDLVRGFSRLDLQPDHGFGVSLGDGTAEVVKLRKPRTDIDIELSNRMEDGDDDAALKILQRWASGDAPGFLALWQDRDEDTNERRHWQRLVLDPKSRLTYPPGVARRTYRLGLTAISEGA